MTEQKLTQEEIIRQALSTYEEAYRDEISGNRENGVVIGITSDQAWQELRYHRAGRGGEEIYKRIIAEAVGRRE